MVSVDLARFARALGGAKRVGIDTQVLIYHMQDVAPYAELTTHLLTQAATGAVQLIISAVTISEVLVGPLKAGRPTWWIEAALSALPSMVVGDVTWEVARKGAELRARTNLPLPDALILASAIEQGAQLVVTNDIAWRIKRLPCRILVLEDYV